MITYAAARYEAKKGRRKERKNEKKEKRMKGRKKISCKTNPRGTEPILFSGRCQDC